MKVYTLRVCLGKLPSKKPEVYRVIDIASSHTLAELHDAIMEAFDRSDEEFAEFTVKGKTYLFPVDDTGEFEDALFTGMGSLKLVVGDRFDYMFSHRREIRHVIEVLGIENRPDWNEDNWPMVVEKVGK